MRPRQNGHHFLDDIFKCIFLNENVWISIKISLKFVPKGPINNIPALVQIMAWRRSGDKPLSEPMVVRLSTHICVTRPQWVANICHCSLTLALRMQWSVSKKTFCRNKKTIVICIPLLSILEGGWYFGRWTWSASWLRYSLWKSANMWLTFCR